MIFVILIRFEYKKKDETLKSFVFLLFYSVASSSFNMTLREALTRP